MRALSMMVLATLLGTSAALYSQTEADLWNQCKDANSDQAIAGCTAIIQGGKESNANLAIAFTNRGIAYAHKPAYDRAIQDYDQAIKLDPAYIPAYLDRGSAYRAKGEYDQAIQDDSQAIQINPGYVAAYVDRGLAYAGKGAFDQAIQDYDQAIKLNPSYIYAFNDRGNAYSIKGEYDRAIEDYDQTLKLDPTYALAFNNRANTYLRMGEYDRAIPDFDQSLKLTPNYLNALLGRGAAHFYMGQFDAAETDFAAAVKSTPTDAYSVLWLYVTQSKAGKTGRATLEQNAGQIDRTVWPGQVVDLILGKTTTAAVLSAASAPNTYKDRSQRCEAYFFLAENALIAGRRIEARRLFQQALATGATWEIQYAGAKEELKRLQPAAHTTTHP